MASCWDKETQTDTVRAVPAVYLRNFLPVEETSCIVENTACLFSCSTCYGKTKTQTSSCTYNTFLNVFVYSVVSSLDTQSLRTASKIYCILCDRGYNSLFKKFT